MAREYLRQVGLICLIADCGKPATRKGHCESHRMLDWKKRNPIKAAAAQLRSLDRFRRKNYGIGNADVDAMLAQQGGCAVCGATVPGTRTWHVDHDHNACGMVIRGILCNRCNVVLGQVGDDIETLFALIHYLQHRKAKAA
jgi:hypothetical protein